MVTIRSSGPARHTSMGRPTVRAAPPFTLPSVAQQAGCNRMAVAGRRAGAGRKVRAWAGRVLVGRAKAVRPVSAAAIRRFWNIPVARRSWRGCATQRSQSRRPRGISRMAAARRATSSAFTTTSASCAAGWSESMAKVFGETPTTARERHAPEIPIVRASPPKTSKHHAELSIMA